jgi:VWFA-related protein
LSDNLTTAGESEKLSLMDSAIPRLTALAAATTGLLFAQSPTTLRTETRVVQIDVEVRDSHGRPVAGLGREDFTVTDAGKAREIRIFSVQDNTAQHEESAPVAATPPGIYTNDRPPAPRSVHSTVILMDGINNYWDDFAAARMRLISMLGKLRKEERIAIYAALTKPAGIAIIQDFTTDRTQLLRTIQAYRPPPITPAPGMISAPPPPPAEEEQRRRTAVLDTMSAFRLLSEHLGKLPGRKSLLWLTSGMPPKELREMPDPFDKAAAALNEANIAVDVMDDDGVGDFHRRWGKTAYWTLRQLADSTGGKTYVGRNDLDNMLTEAIEQSRIIYTLGFYVPDEERDDKFHALKVRVNRPKVELAYRKGYFAGAAPKTAPTKKREPLENTLLDPQDSNEILITAAIARVAEAGLRVSMKLGGAQLSLLERGNEFSGSVEELFVETDASGRILAKITDRKEIRMSQRGREAIQNGAVPLTQDLRWMEGAVRLFIAVRDVESGRTGTLTIPLPESVSAR